MTDSIDADIRLLAAHDTAERLSRAAQSARYAEHARIADAVNARIEQGFSIRQAAAQVASLIDMSRSSIERIHLWERRPETRPQHIVKARKKHAKWIRKNTL